ncbi:MAG: hypothetical protein ACYCS1_02005 [Gammaproteobacteria bacterium]
MPWVFAALVLLFAPIPAHAHEHRSRPTVTAPYVRQPYGVRSHAEAGLRPVIDPSSEPFDWYRYPRTIIGVYGGPEQALITPRGFVRNDFGTLGLLIGRHDRPMNQRIKTLFDGWLPIVEASFERAGIRYHVEYFASTVHGLARVPYTIQYGVDKLHLTAPVQNMVTFVKYQVTNTSNRSRTVRLTLALGHRALFKKRYQVFRSPSRPRQVTFQAPDRAWVGTGKLLYAVSRQPTRVIGGPQDRLKYHFRLKPFGRQTLVVKIPYFVARASDAGLLSRAHYARYRMTTIAFWKHLISKATKISVDEPRVVNTYRASLVLLLMDSLHRVGGRDFTHANFDIYDRFFMRDTAFNMKALIDAGYTRIARASMLSQLPFYQYPNGMFQSQAHEYDGNGEALWMMGEYVRHTHDLAFARRVFPMIQRSMAWQWHFRRAHWAHSGGLYPALEMPDDEEVRGHIVGYDLFAIAGARAAASIACALHQTRLCLLWRKRSEQYARILRCKITPAFDALGVVPPAIEGMRAKGFVDGWYGKHYGIDWGNLEIVWPSEVLGPFNRMVAPSLRTWRERSFEGEITYPADGREDFLHSYLSLLLLETYIRRNSDWHALQSLYSALVHTTATHMAAEGMNAAARWGWNAKSLTLPHDQFAAQYISSLRDVMAFALHGNLYVANVLSPIWLAHGHRVRFAGETRFGYLSFRAERRRHMFTVLMHPPSLGTERRIYVHVPRNDAIVSVQGVRHWSIDERRNAVILKDPGVGVIRLRIGVRERYPAPAFSFARAVSDYELNYHKMLEPVSVTLSHLHLATTRIEAGHPITVSATLTNRGGAGTVTTPIRLLVNGRTVASHPPQIARGIGFTTPARIISFGHHPEGVVEVSLTTRIPVPGRYTVTLELGSCAPLPAQLLEVAPAQRSTRRTQDTGNPLLRLSGHRRGAFLLHASFGTHHG